MLEGNGAETVKSTEMIGSPLMVSLGMEVVEGTKSEHIPVYGSQGIGIPLEEKKQIEEGCRDEHDDARNNQYTCKAAKG